MQSTERQIGVVKTRVMTSLKEFSECRQAWNSLMADRVFHSWEWMYSWWENYCDTGQLAVVIVEDQLGGWAGIAPWFKTSSASRGNVVRSLGSGAACSDYVSFVSKPGFEAIVAKALVEQMFGHNQHELFSDVDLFEFEGHQEDDPLMQRLLESVPNDLAGCLTEEIGGAWRTELPATWEEFEGSLRKSFRRKTRKARKRLDSGEFDTKVYLLPEEIENNWSVFVDLHQRRRNSLGQPGCFADERFERFLKAASVRLAASARAQLNVVYHQGPPLTCNLEFTSGDSNYMYQTGMDPDKLKLEPGHINFTWAIGESINQQYRYFDFLRGDERYKQFWNSQRVNLCRTRFVTNRFSSNLRFSIVSAGKQMRSLAQNVKSKFENRK